MFSAAAIAAARVFGRPAEWRVGGTAAPVAVPVQLRRADRLLADGMLVATTAVDVPAALAPTLARGDTLTLDGAVWRVVGDPRLEAGTITAEVRAG